MVASLIPTSALSQNVEVTSSRWPSTSCHEYVRIHQPLRRCPGNGRWCHATTRQHGRRCNHGRGMGSGGQLIVTVPRFQARRRLRFLLSQQLKQRASLVFVCRLRQELTKLRYILLTDKLLHGIAPGYRDPMPPCAFGECLSRPLKTLHQRAPGEARHRHVVAFFPDGGTDRRHR